MFYFNVMVEFQIDLAQILKLGFKVRVDLGVFFWGTLETIHKA